MALTLEQTARLVGTELWRKRLPLALAGVVAGLILLVVGFMWPKWYNADSFIFVSGTDVVNPLMEGTAWSSGVRDHVGIAREIMHGRRVLDRVLSEVGILNESMSGPERDFIREQVRDKLDVRRVGDYLIKVQYYDNDARRAYEVVRRTGEYFVQEAQNAMKQESKEAYAFIDSQVKHYHAKLLEAEERLNQFRSDNVEALPGAERDVTNTISGLRRQIDQTQLQIRELETRRDAIKRQLRGELSASTMQARDRRILERMKELQDQLDLLRLNYTEDYPDVVTARRQIDELQMQLSMNMERDDTLAGAEDSSVETSPLYQELRSNQAQTETEIEMLGARVDNLASMMKREINRAQQVSTSDTQLQELNRDYEVTVDQYQDLLRRRENARISVNLELEQQGVTLKIQEPAELPTRPRGVRFVHFAIAGGALILMLPVVMAFGLAKFDPRIREPSQLTHDHHVPVLAVVPRLHNDGDRLASRLRTAACILLGCVVVVAYGVAGWMKYTGAI